MTNEYFWKKSYDTEIDDLDPHLWEITLVSSNRQSFAEFRDKTALAFMGVEISYTEFDTYSNRFANMLISNGLSKGDVAVQDEEGYLKIVDRTKDMINVSGFKVFSKKIEEILTAHPTIEEIATIGIPDPGKPGSEFVKAYIIPAEKNITSTDKDSLAEEITAFAKEKLAPYEVPRQIEFRDELPLTSVGKLDKKLLRKENL